MEAPQSIEFSVGLSGSKPIVLLAVFTETGYQSAAWEATPEEADMARMAMPASSKLVDARYLWNRKS